MAQNPLQRLEADMTVDGAALSLAAGVCSREAERYAHAGELDHAWIFLEASRLLLKRHDAQAPMMVQPRSET